MTAVTAILALIQAAPTAIQEITTLYNAIKGTFSSQDQTAIDQALAAAIAADAASTKAADAALDAAAKR